jgi:hypothetical protein
MVLIFIVLMNRKSNKIKDVRVLILREGLGKGNFGMNLEISIWTSITSWCAIERLFKVYLFRLCAFVRIEEY